jgi:hypothetical protein
MHPDQARSMVCHHMTKLADEAEARRVGRPRRRPVVAKG